MNIDEIIDYINNNLEADTDKNILFFVKEILPMDVELSLEDAACILNSCPSLIEVIDRIRKDNVQISESVFYRAFNIVNTSDFKGMNINGYYLEMYYRDIRQFDVFTREEEQEQFKLYSETKSKEVFDNIVNHNLKLVVGIAKMYAFSNDNLLDLIQYGNEGLMEAVKHFDYRFNFKFSGYARYWINHYIINSIFLHENIIRIPRQAIVMLRKMERIKDKYLDNDGIAPSVEDYARELNCSESLVKDRIKLDNLRKIISLDSQMNIDDDNEFCLLDKIKYNDSNFEDIIVDKMYYSEVLDFLKNNLSKKEYDVLTLRYGLNDDSGLTLSKIGKTYDVTRSRIHQIEKKALKKSQKKLVLKKVVCR